jgi:hypothetical protein
MIVSGAGTSAANGTYAEDGVYQGKPQYKKSDGNLIRYSTTGPRWVIGGSNLYFDDDCGWQGTRYYRTTNGPSSPELGTWEKVGSGVDPAPTVTADGGGTTGTLLRVNMNAQMNNYTGGLNG